MTEPVTLNGSIEGDTTGAVLGHLRGIKEAVAKLPVAPTEVFGFTLDASSSGKSTNRLATHVKINVQSMIITGDNFPATVTFNIGGRSFPFSIDASSPIPFPFPIKWDRGVDAWFSCDAAQTALNCYLIGTAE